MSRLHSRLCGRLQWRRARTGKAAAVQSVFERSGHRFAWRSSKQESRAPVL